MGHLYIARLARSLSQQQLHSACIQTSSPHAGRAGYKIQREEPIRNSVPLDVPSKKCPLLDLTFQLGAPRALNFSQIKLFQKQVPHCRDFYSAVIRHQWGIWSFSRPKNKRKFLRVLGLFTAYSIIATRSVMAFCSLITILRLLTEAKVSNFLRIIFYLLFRMQDN